LELDLQPQLRLLSEELSLGADGVVPLRLENSGYGTLYVTVTPADSWLQVNRREWTIKAGKKAQVKVSLLDPPSAGARGHINVHALDRVVQVPVYVTD
jgi:hypothetical protein